MKKKILLVSIISALCISLTACGAGDINTNSVVNSNIENTSSQKEEINANPLDYEYSYDGLVKYLKACEIISENATESDRTYSYFDAIDGKAYSYSSVTVELYEMYSKNNNQQAISEKAKSFINDARNNNKVTVIGQDIHAFVSDNSKFLIVYLSNSSNEEDIDAENNFKKAINDFCSAQDNKKNLTLTSQPENENNTSSEQN